MDTLTHALSGALLAQALPRRPASVGTAAAVAAGFAAGAFPDIDVVTALVSPVFYLTQHRGLTHSLLLLPLWAALLAWLFARIDRRRPSWRAYFGIAAGAIGIHILGDLITAFGTMVFAPLSDWRVAWSTTFIIDPWFTGIIVAGLLAGLAWRGQPQPARIALAVLAGYVGLQAICQQQARALGEAHARAQGLGAFEVSAIPRPVSPFNWMIVVSDDNARHYANVNLLRDRIPPAAAAEAGLIECLDAAYRPAGQADWRRLEIFGETPEQREFARRAWARPEFAVFRWFADLPLASPPTASAQGRCAWFRDLRFLVAGRPHWPFHYGVCEDRDGRWQLHEWATDGPRALPVQPGAATAS